MTLPRKKYQCMERFYGLSSDFFIINNSLVLRGLHIGMLIFTVYTLLYKHMHPSGRHRDLGVEERLDDLQGKIRELEKQNISLKSKVSTDILYSQNIGGHLIWRFGPKLCVK